MTTPFNPIPFPDDDQPAQLLAFGDDHQPVAITPAPAYQETPAHDPAAELRAEQQRVLLCLLDLLTAGDAGPELIGRRALLLAHLTARAGCRTDTEIATRLNISRGRVSQLRAELSKELHKLGLCNRRQRYRKLELGT